MAAGRIVAADIGMSPHARERAGRFGPATLGRYSRRQCAALLAGLIPGCAIGSLLALAVGLVDGLGTSRLRECWGDRNRGADRKRLDWVAAMRPIVK